MSADRIHNAYNRLNAGSSRDADPPPSTSSPQPRKFLVAVDFGTTYSAAAWVQTRIGNKQRPLIKIIDRWPGQQNTHEKVPTVLQRRDGDLSWGFECDTSAGEERYEWFKLEQDPKYKKHALKKAYPATTIIPKNDQEVQDLITTYLRKLREHVENSIRDSMDFGPMKDALFRDSRWEYIVTVPAMWPEPAQNITEKCAKEAGMAPNDPVKLIAEPEAAGIFALDSISRDIELQPGDTFVICDAGGGTVDLISYTVTSITPSPELEEATAGTGGLCGSSFVDREFDKWLRRHFKSCKKWDKYSQEDALERWESIKWNFTGDEHKKNIIPARGIDDNPSLGVQRQKLEIPLETMYKIFDPVVLQIIDLVVGQINAVDKPVNAVLLAGGFGQNEYLRRRIENAVDKSIKVKRMGEGNTAIVRGALIKVLADRVPVSAVGRPYIAVKSRLARKHYGTKALTRYHPGFHDSKQPRVSGGVDGGEKIDVMTWFIRKNARIKDLDTKSFEFYCDLLAGGREEALGSQGIFELPIFTCEMDEPPLYPDPKDATSTTCKLLVSLRADLGKIPSRKLQKERGQDGQWYYKVQFQIRMTSYLAKIAFELVHDGESYGEVQADWHTN